MKRYAKWSKFDIITDVEYETGETLYWMKKKLSTRIIHLVYRQGISSLSPNLTYGTLIGSKIMDTATYNMLDLLCFFWCDEVYNGIHHLHHFKLASLFVKRQHFVQLWVNHARADEISMRPILGKLVWWVLL